MLQESTQKVKQLFRQLSNNKLVREMGYYGPEVEMITALEEGLSELPPPKGWGFMIQRHHLHNGFP